jgi:DNA-binding NarL/FixJ family response regulator
MIPENGSARAPGDSGEWVDGSRKSGKYLRSVVPSAAKQHFLVVEDRSGFANALKKTLERWGEVTWVRNLDEAVAAFSSGTFSALITDVRLPGRSGFEVLEEFRKLHPSTPAMVLTGYFDEDGSHRACDLGAQYVAKPITLSALMAFVTRRRSFKENVADTLDKWKVRWGLSNAEAEVLHCVACGDSFDAIAKTRGTAKATLVAQLGGVCRKTSNHSSGKMIARFLREAAGQPAICADFSVRERTGVFDIAAQRPSAPHLSERERDVVTRLNLGRSFKEIAYDLGISYATVRTLSRRADAKLGIVGPHAFSSTKKSGRQLDTD